MTCRSVQDRLSAYLDRELASSEMFEIRAHLFDCDGCRKEEESLRDLKRLLASSSVPEPSADFADRLCASVLAEYRPVADPVGASGRIGFRNAALTFAGVATCSMFLTFIILSRTRPTAGPAEMPVAVGSSAQDLAFEVQRDQVYSTGLDPTNGVPVISSPGDHR